MTIFIASDHGGFEMKNKLIDYLQNKNIRVVDIGSYEYDPVDDFPDYTKKLAETVLQNPGESCGIAICRSGGGVTIAANRYKGIRCTLGHNENAVRQDREHNDINILALGADYTDFETATKLVDIFLSTSPHPDEKYARRRKKMDNFS